jgi:uncharacterized protein (AIM24 family)
MKGWWAKTGVFFMHASGTGDLFCASHGAAVSTELADGERFVLDNRYVVAFTDTVKWELVKATQELSTSLMSGEGLVNRYTGPGTIVYQTRAQRRRSSGLVALVADAIF